MTKIAILLASSEYELYDPLNACKNDLEMMKNLLEASGEFSNILTSLNDSASIAQDKIIDFIKVFEGKDIEQIFFYFSGHGYRDSNNFYFCFKDTNLELLKSTTITNDVIDSYLKRLNPKVAVKVVDACYSGENYIKEAEDSLIRKNLDKEYSFDEVYFMYSSRGNETSEATNKYSKFTKLFFDAILKQKQSDRITYKAVIDYISDLSEKRLSHTPIFVTQGAYLAYLFNSLTAPKEILSAIDLITPIVTGGTPLERTPSLIEMIKKESEMYCSEEEGIKKIKQIFNLIEKHKFSQDIETLFTPDLSRSDIVLFNAKDIGNWLVVNKDKDEYLVEEHYHEIEVPEKKYIKYPRKPRSAIGSSSLSFLLGLNSEDDYRLEDVAVKKQVLDGIRYLVPLEQVFLSIRFIPKEDFQNLKNYSACFAVIFSKKEIVLFYSIEKLKIFNWTSTYQPECSKWNYVTMLLKDNNQKVIDKICQKIEEFIFDDVKKSLTLIKDSTKQSETKS